MNTDLIASAFAHSLPIDRLRRDVPSAFAERPYENVSDNYLFISTSQVISALRDAGFEAVSAKQTRSRGDRASFTKHMIRFQQSRDSLVLVDAVPQIILINSHDATSAYQLRAGLYRPVCTNGMLCEIGDFGVVHVPHRGNIVANVVDAALTIMAGFSNVSDIVQQMAATPLNSHQKLRFAQEAARIRFKDVQHLPFDPHRLLEARRDPDSGDDVWHVYNVVQENVMRGGIAGKTALGRSIRSRGIRAIREDVRINHELWNLAMSLLRG